MNDGATRLISVEPSGVPAKDDQVPPAISGDGSRIAAVGGDSLVVYDMGTRTTRTAFDRYVSPPFPLGRRAIVAVTFDAAFAPEDREAEYLPHDVYVRDVERGTSAMVSVTSRERGRWLTWGLGAAVLVAAAATFVLVRRAGTTVIAGVSVPGARRGRQR
jgi:hypothetical protein